MGSFYTNVALRGVDQSEVAEYLAGRNRQVLVSPTIEGVTVVYDALTESQDPRLLTNLARELSAQLDCPALAALNHDEDVLWLQLHVDGRLVDQYNSSPSYFEDGSLGEPEGGDADALCEAFGASDREDEVEQILRKPDGADGYSFASERHTDLAGALDIPPELVSFGYEHLTGGEMPAGYQPRDFLHTGPVPQPMAPSQMGQPGPTGGPGGPGGPADNAGEAGPGPGHVRIGPAPGAGCCGCLLAPLLIPLGIVASAVSAWLLRRQAEEMNSGQQS